jgi:hypothetical protein
MGNDEGAIYIARKEGRNKKKTKKERIGGNIS